MENQKLLLLIGVDALWGVALQTLIPETLKDINVRSFPPAEVETSLRGIAPQSVAAIVIDADIKGASFDNGVQFIQRLRAIYRLASSMILLSYEPNSPASILTYPGHFFLPRPFRLEAFYATLDLATTQRLTSDALQEVIADTCDLRQYVTAFRRGIVSHGVRSLEARVRLALNGKLERLESKLANALAYLIERRQRTPFTDLFRALSTRFKRQVLEIEGVFDQMQYTLEAALELVQTPSMMPNSQQLDEKSVIHTFVQAFQQLNEILSRIENQLQRFGGD